MLNKIISISFILLFVTTIALPTVVFIVDDSIEVSFFNDYSEDEEEKGSEKNKELETLVENSIQDLDHIMSIKEKLKTEYFVTAYPKPHINLVFPPPDFS